MHLSLSPLMKYVKRKAYADFKKGMKDWYLTGMKHTKAVKELVKNTDKMGKSLDEDIGNVCFSNRYILHHSMHKSITPFYNYPTILVRNYGKANRKPQWSGFIDGC